MGSRQRSDFCRRFRHLVHSSLSSGPWLPRQDPLVAGGPRRTSTASPSGSMQTSPQHDASPNPLQLGHGIGASYFGVMYLWPWQTSHLILGTRGIKGCRINREDGHQVQNPEGGPNVDHLTLLRLIAPRFLNLRERLSCLACFLRRLAVAVTVMNSGHFCYRRHDLLLGRRPKASDGGCSPSGSVWFTRAERA
jgi:hypothetical protein